MRFLTPIQRMFYGIGAIVFWALLLCVVPTIVDAHEGHHAWSNHEGHASVHHQRLNHRSINVGVGKTEANEYFNAFSSLVAKWPLPCREELIAQSAREHQFLHDDPKALELIALRARRREVLQRLTSLVPTYRMQIQDSGPKLLSANRKPISVCPGIPTLVLIECVNQTSRKFDVRARSSFRDQANTKATTVPPGRKVLLSDKVDMDELDRLPAGATLQIECDSGQRKDLLAIPIRFVKPASLKLRLTKGNGPQSEAGVPGRITVQCSDGICRYGGRYAGKSTFTDKPIIYPPIGTWQKLPFFYADQLVELEVPPGPTRVTFERGFEHRREIVDLMLMPGDAVNVERACKRMTDMAALGWISGDTHVHWVTNGWNVDEPLELLSMAQRAEDLKVVNNLTLLQRNADQAFVKPSQAPMGPVLKHSDNQFHIQMGEEFRNEDLYGHLCLLNIDWLVQPIGTGSIIAGPDALDYPINRTAIEACRIQGGISIEAHGTGGNKDVPINVIHRLTDSLDQMEPAMYYRLLDCGFRLPLTNGSDHPARILGAARAYVNVQGRFSYDRWIDGIRMGRTFTTSGPLISLEVNDAQIGDVIFPGSNEQLHVKAKVISRDPIGTVQILSNGKVLFSRETNDSNLDVEITIPAKESRWIIARCSNRQDGRADWGFGDFNAITGSGIAHTSPVYVHVDGVPRFDPVAADFWRERMRSHARHIQGRGRFADDSQREEAVGYIEQGIQMFQDLKSQVKLARSKDEAYEQAKHRLANVIRRFGKSAPRSRVLEMLESASSFDALGEAIAPLTLLRGSVNSQSQFVLEATAGRIVLKQGRPQRFLVAIDNQSGVTGPLMFDAYDVHLELAKIADWCSLEVVDSPFTSAFLTGATREYKVVEFVARKGGKREIKFAARIGDQAIKTSASTTDKLTVDVKWRRRSAEFSNNE